MRHDPAQSFTSAERIEAGGARGSALDALAPELTGILRILTCGSVDDGKSTLIGRLLWDASPLYDDQRERLLKETVSLNGSRRPDFSRLVDGLIAEREQGITIDIAWHPFDTATRRFVIIDAPGHEQYTRNMATGASHADAALLLVDAQSGIKRQTRRHLAILDLAGVRHVLLVVNKMDLVGWSKTRFDDIASEFAEIASLFPRISWQPVPISALGGDNVAFPSAAMEWYSGRTVLNHLEALPGRAALVETPFRMPVQLVLRDNEGFRGLAGTVAAGKIRIGDEVADMLSGKTSTVSAIRTFDGDLTEARSGQAIVLGLGDDLDISRGSVLLHAPGNQAAARAFEGNIVWLADEGCDPRAGYLVRTAADLTPVTAFDIRATLDLETLEAKPSSVLTANDVANVSIELARPVAVDPFSVQPATGSFLLLNAVTGAVAGAGTVTAIIDNPITRSFEGFELTRDVLERGLSSDLDQTDKGQAEFKRRANEVALILRAAGVPVRLNV